MIFMTAAETAPVKAQRDEPVRGWVLYDGECPLCCATAARFTPLLLRHRYPLASLQTPWVQERLGLQPGAPLDEMKLLAADGKIFGGAAALLQIARHIRWAWPMFALAKIPGVKISLWAAYRRVARNRFRSSQFITG